MAFEFDYSKWYAMGTEYSLGKLFQGGQGRNTPPVYLGLVKSRGRSRYDKRRALTNPTRKLKDAIRDSVAFALEVTADELVDETKALLLEKHGNGPDWTGALYDSIHHDAVEIGQTEVTVRFYADATNQYNGAMYAQFLEEGTGDGEKTWRYKGRMRTYVDPETGKVTESEWYTTKGIKADPFLDPPIEGAKKRLAERCKGEILSIFDPHWYKGSLQLWKDNQKQQNTGGGIRTDV